MYSSFSILAARAAAAPAMFSTVESYAYLSRSASCRVGTLSRPRNNSRAEDLDPGATENRSTVVPCSVR